MVPPLCAHWAHRRGRRGTRTGSERAVTAAARAQRRPARSGPLPAAWAAYVGRARRPWRLAVPPGGRLASAAWALLLWRCDLATARLTRLRASGGSEAAAGELGLAWQWPMAKLAPGGSGGSTHQAVVCAVRPCMPSYLDMSRLREIV